MEALTPGLVAEVACSAKHWLEVEEAVLELLLRHVGADTAFFADARGPSETAVGVLAERRPQLLAAWSKLGEGMAPLLNAARAGNGVVVDSELLGQGLKRLPYYQVIMRPVRGCTTLMAFLSTGARQTPRKLVLGRCVGTGPFRSNQQALLASLVPTLSLAAAALDDGACRNPPSALEVQRLTAREREVLSYLHLGYTNREIGCALGTRERTVRNQLTQVYAKLGVANRAEAVGLLLDITERIPA